MMTINNNLVVEHFRCPEMFVAPETATSSRSVLSVLGNQLNARSRIVSRPAVLCAIDELLAADSARVSNTDEIPELVNYLRYERYVTQSADRSSLVRSAYYLVRPFLPISVRKHLQRASLRGRLQADFPHWPLDTSVDRLLEKLLLSQMQSAGLEEIPFVWFWPNRHSGCAIVTHDVETVAGFRFCSQLMDINDSYGVKTSFQLIPEKRYVVSPEFIEQIRNRGFEVNVHDLNHDGHLFDNWRTFSSRIQSINSYARKFGACGFRSGALYHNVDWYRHFQFSYDMSLANVGHLDPQGGGCCTVMPFFIGDLLELPVTTVQDYSLLHFLGEYSIELWMRQLAMINGYHGLASFIIHPDYIKEKKANEVYRSLLEYLVRLRSEKALWIALPREVDEWWRERSAMRLVREEHEWAIEGRGKEKASIAYARVANGNLSISLTPTAARTGVLAG